MALCFFFYSYGYHRDLHSFPTRRSSDLARWRWPRAYRVRGSAAPRRRGAERRKLALSPRLRRSEEHTSELQSRVDLVCRLLLEKKKQYHHPILSSSRPSAIAWTSEMMRC